MGLRAVSLVVLVCMASMWSASPIAASKVDHLCPIIETFTEDVPQIGFRQVTETYVDNECVFGYYYGLSGDCVRTETINRPEIQYVPVVRTKKVDACCVGYKMDPWSECKAVCTTYCGSNGICSAPETCSCNEGFMLTTEKG